MYPRPPSSYPSQITQQPSQFMSPVATSTIQPSFPSHPPLSGAPPLPPSTYPNSQYNYNSNSAAATHPGQQPPPAPQTMPYGMGGSTAGVSTQQNNNLNGPASVRNIFLVYTTENSVLLFFEDQ